ncbi:50S ribosomal protein L13 [Candidatus Woesearchaeota archaeon]|nr:50S ribosomal protein L13 [Candidatus Woesearchaeota archaeon]
MIINAENLILGRMSTVIAKKALLGESIDVVNAEKAVIVGNKVNILENYLNKIRRGDTMYGPYFPRTPDRLVRRAIRGMLPHKQEKGKSAFKRIRCYIGVPEDLKDKKLETIDNAKLSKRHINYMTVKELSKYMGAKNYGS